ncbi:DNA methylase [Candidatus Endobugula sertula]|uniref:Methyltransferase n=1 Tax=Candidatus Endobugula sertula TaxID=62101 RepID=A0A1D2QLM9_9GAMM|nr:DNA methylase [Candidatus Endobugula sertula]
MAYDLVPSNEKHLPRNRILCGESAALLASFPSESVDLVVTDPPYLINYRDRDGRTVMNDDNPEAVLSVYDELYRVLKPNSYCISFYGWSTIAAFSERWKQTGFNIAGHFVWHKNYQSSAGHVGYCHESAYLLVKGNPIKPQQPLPDVQAWDYSGNKSHPTEKAVSILTPLINTYSNQGGVVLDPFSGSGSTAVSAVLNGRDYIGIELVQRYCELAERRIAGACRYLDQAA